MPQEHGGALLPGGKKGNKGGKGGGRPPSVIRDICRESFASRIKFLERVADGKVKQEISTREGIVKIGASVADRVRAVDTLGRYAGIEKITVEADPERETLSGEQVLRRILPIMERLAGMNIGADRLAKAVAVEAQVVQG